MRNLILFLVLLIAAVLLGVETIRHPGYVLITANPWFMQMPLWFALASFLTFIFILYILIASCYRLRLLVFRFSHWLSARRAQQLYSLTQLGIAALIEHQFKKADQLLAKGISQAQEPFINYLALAKVAQEESRLDKRNYYLQKAHIIAPKNRVAIDLLRAEFQIASLELEEALATLQALEQHSANHPRILILLYEVYRRLHDWKNLPLLLPKLFKSKAIAEDEREAFAITFYTEQLTLMPFAHVEALHETWQAVPKAIQKQPEVVIACVQQLHKFNDTDRAKQLLQKTLNSVWHPMLLELYTSHAVQDVHEQLTILGKWHKQYGERKELLIALGKLCVKAKLYGKARDYFAKSLKLSIDAKTALAYSQLLQQLGESEAAVKLANDTLMALANSSAVQTL